MKEWWNGLQPRERRTLSIGAVVVVLSVIYFGLWEPFRNEVRQMEQAVEKNRALLAWMERSAAEVAALKGRAAAAAPGRGGDRSLLALVDQTARRARLGPALKRVEPEGKEAVRVWLEQAAFDDVVRWITQLEQKSGVRIESITIDRQEAPGRVNARIRFRGPAA